MLPKQVCVCVSVYSSLSVCVCVVFICNVMCVAACCLLLIVVPLFKHLTFDVTCWAGGFM